MKRLTIQITNLEKNIDTVANATGIPANLREQFDLTCIARDAAALDRRLDRALRDFFSAAHDHRRTRDELRRAARRVCVFVVDAARHDPRSGDRVTRLKRLLRTNHGTDAFHGLAPELLEIAGGMEGPRAATHAVRLAGALRAHLDAGGRVEAAREIYTHLLETSVSLACTLKTLNRSLRTRLDGAGACETGARAAA